MKQQISRSAIIILLVFFSCTGCRWKEDTRLPGYLQLRLTANPTTLDPALITDVMGASIAARLFNGLVRFNDNLDIVPDLARSWTLSSDGKTYTFRLRKDASFANGRLATAEDVRYSFERVLSPKTRAPLTWVLERIDGAKEFMAGKTNHVRGIRVIDNQTVEIRLKRPFGPFLSLLGMATAFIVPKEEVERTEQDFGSHPSGTGPFVLTEWKHGQSITLAARKDYFDGSPRLAGIRYRIIPEDLTAVIEFETGGLDVLTIPASEFKRYTTNPKWKNRVIGKPGLNCYYLGLNCSRPPFNDKRVRQAMNLAIDRRRILETIYEKRGVIAHGPIPPALWKYGRKKSSRLYDYDPAEARRLIKEAGAEGAKITITISAEQEVLDITEVLQNYLAQAGIKAEIKQLDWSAYKEALNRGETDAFWLSWWADYPDPENFFYPLFHSINIGPAGNRTWYRNPRFDRLIEQAQTTVDPILRYRLYETAENLLIEDAPWVFMWHRSEYAVVQPWIFDYRIPAIYSVDKGTSVYLAE